MSDIDFPLFKTKSEEYKKFDLTDAEERQAYFEYKAGDEIKKLRKYLENNTFVCYLMGKKSSGKGTYAKMLAEVIDRDENGKPLAESRIAHFSIGDMVRSFDESVNDEAKKKELVAFLEENYRGFLPLDDIVKALENRSTKTLLPTELILALAKREIKKLGKKAIFLDGFPRDIDQLSYSLFFRDIIGHGDDKDFFALINVPTNVIDERVKYRVICPKCQTSRNLKLLATKNVEYDKEDKKFHLICDDATCGGARMVTKEGDEQGIEPIKERLEKDEMLMGKVHELQGMPTIYLRNSIPADKTKEYTDDYEITPGYEYTYNEAENKVETTEKAWEVDDDTGVKSNSLMPPPVVVSLIKKMTETLGL